MPFAAEREALEAAREAAKAFFDKTGEKPKVLSEENLSTFTGELGNAFRLILAEKEILFFAALQWLVSFCRLFLRRPAGAARLDRAAGGAGLARLRRFALKHDLARAMRAF